MSDKLEILIVAKSKTKSKEKQNSMSSLRTPSNILLIERHDLASRRSLRLAVPHLGLLNCERQSLPCEKLYYQRVDSRREL